MDIKGVAIWMDIKGVAISMDIKGAGWISRE